MQFFLYEIVARLVAIYLFLDCGRQLRHGLIERKIAHFNPNLLDWSHYVVHRDTRPILYWIEISFRIVALVSCLVVAIFGWWHPDT